MKRRIRPVIALILVLCAVVSLFGCGINFGGDKNDPGNDINNNGDKNGGNGDKNNGNGGNVTDVAKSKPTNVYRETEFSFGVDPNMLWGASLYGGRIYYTQNEYNDETGVNINTIMSTSISNQSDAKKHVSIDTQYHSEDGIYSSTYLNSFAVAPDGTIWTNMQSYYEDYTDPDYPIYEYNNFLQHYNDSGEMILELSTSDLIPDSTYMYFGEMKFQGNLLYIVTGSTIIVLDTTTGKMAFKMSDESMYIEKILQTSDSSIGALVYSYEEGTRALWMIDPAVKGWGEKIVFESNAYLDYIMPGDSDYLVYYSAYNQGIMGLKKDGTSEEIVSFINSDIDSTSVSNMMKLETGEFLLFGYDYESARGDLRVTKLTKVPDDEIREAIMLTYACIYPDYEFRRKVLSFNKTNGEYRINIHDYSQYNVNDNYNAGYDRLNADIISGKIPDIISLDGLDFRTYANKGVLADLYELMESSKTVNRDDYLENVLTAAEYDGKLYRFMSQFSVQTTMGKRSIFGDKDNWTFDDYEAMVRSRPGSQLFGYMTREDVLYTCLSTTVNSYIDWETGKCSFDEGFIKLLEFAMDYPEIINWDELYSDPDYYEKMQYNYSEERFLLQYAYVGSYRAIRDQGYDFGEEICFPGYPTSDGNGSVFNAYLQHGISASSPHKQVCFDFIASTVETTPKFEDAGGYFYGQFSISKAYMEAVKQYEMTPMKQRPGYESYEDEIGIARDKMAGSLISSTLPMPAPDPGYEENDYEANYHLTAEEIAAVDKLIESTKTFITYNEQVMNIITEETAEFFAGRRSASDTARIIQSRVKIMVSESM